MEFRVWVENNQQKQLDFMNDSKVVSFDFDGVLHVSMHRGTTHPLSYDDPDLEPRWEMHEQLRKEARNGNKIIVVTARCYDWPLREFIEEYSLPVEGIFVTCDQTKIPILKSQGAIRHYDDNRNMEWEVDQAIDDGILPTNFEFIYVPMVE